MVYYSPALRTSRAPLGLASPPQTVRDGRGQVSRGGFEPVAEDPVRPKRSPTKIDLTRSRSSGLTSAYVRMHVCRCTHMLCTVRTRMHLDVQAHARSCPRLPALGPPVTQWYIAAFKKWFGSRFFETQTPPLLYNTTHAPFPRRLLRGRLGRARRHRGGAAGRGG